MPLSYRSQSFQLSVTGLMSIAQTIYRFPGLPLLWSTVILELTTGQFRCHDNLARALKENQRDGSKASNSECKCLHVILTPECYSSKWEELDNLIKILFPAQ